MQRIVNGHYADPNSTRDIVGITPKQFNIIIGVLQQSYQAIELMLSAEPEKRRLFFQAGLDAELLPDGAPQTADGVEAELLFKEEQEIDRMNTIYEILKDINQPYPGAVY